MGKIYIISSKSDIYEQGSTMTQMQFLDKYFKAFPGDQYNDYYQRIPMPAATDQIAKKLDIDFKYVA